MQYDVMRVAEYIVEKCNRDSKVITNRKLQSILYFIQAQFLVRLDTPCFPDEIEAWTLGPTVENVYKKYMPYGATHIPVVFPNKNIDNCFTKEARLHMDMIIELCNSYSERYLMEVTMRQDPWVNVMREEKTSIILKESIKEFFKDDGIVKNM